MSDAEAAAAHLRRLRWTCRRGAKELDLLLLGYLERCYGAADEPERAAFERLLEAEDPDLANWLYGRTQPDDPLLAGIVMTIRRQRAPVR